MTRVERYGHYSLAAESMYDHPFQWGSKRTGPDLARVGGRYSDEWQRPAPQGSAQRGAGKHHAQLQFPLPKRSWTCPILPATLVALRRVGVPYSDIDIEMAPNDLMAQANPDLDAGDLTERLSQGADRDYDGDPARVTEMDALVAYLQMLGTLVDVNSAAAQEQLVEEKGR